MMTGLSSLQRALRVWLMAMACAWLGLAAHAGTGPWPLQVDVLVDSLGQERIETVSALQRAASFVPSGQGFATGYTRQVHWIRLQITPPAGHAGEAVLTVLPPFLDDVRLYWPVDSNAAPAGRYQERIAGDMQPFAVREIAYRGHAFALSFQNEIPVVAFMRVETTSSLIFLPRVWGRAEFADVVTLDYTLLGLSYGILLTVLVMHLGSGFWREAPAHRLYMIYLLVCLGHHLFINGLAAQFFWPEYPMFTNTGATWLALLSMSVGAAFYKNVLLVQADKTPWLIWIFRLAIGGPVLAWLLMLFGGRSDLMKWVAPLTLLMAACGLGRSLQLLMQGRSGSRFLVLASAFSLGGGLAYVLLLLGVMPVSEWLLQSYQNSNLLALIALNFSLMRSLREQQRLREVAEREMALAQQSMMRESALREEQTQFMAMMSHEIKNPLSSIEAAADALQDLHPALSEAEKVRLARIHRGVAQIDHLMNQLIRQDHFSQAAAQLSFSRVDVRQLCAEAIEATGQRERFQFQNLLDESMFLRADPTWVRLALDNLLDNALKYGGADTLVDLTVHSDAQGILIDVADRGAGIPEELRQKVFDRYFRSPQVGHLPGAGLGLHLVQCVTQWHKGDVRVLARPGGGTLMRWRLPHS